MQGEDIICIASIDWEFNWQGHQEIMMRLVQEGNRVLFIENTGIRAPRWKDLPRLWLRLRNWLHSTYGIREIRPNLFVYSPLTLPFPYGRWACWINRLLMMVVLAPWFRTMRFRNPIVWTFLPTRLALTLADTFRPKLLVYYCIADFEALHPNAKKIRRYEVELVRKADVVFAQGERLQARCAQWNSRTSVFPFGVDVELFETASKALPPADLQSLGRPILGYVGGLHRHLDVSLIQELARMKPEWSLVLVGPQQEALTEMSAIPNVHILGSKPHNEIPAYIKHFDVCMIPYLMNTYTGTVYPTKLNEYLVLDKPVVSTPLPEVEAFNRRHNDIVRIARDPKEFSETISDLIKGDGHLNQRFHEIALQYSWKLTTEKMTEIIEVTLQEKKSSLEQGWQAVLRMTLRKLQIRTCAALLLLSFSYWLIFHSSALWWLARPLKIADSVQAVDAIVVVGGGAGESGQAGQGYQERVQFAADLYGRKIAKNVVFSSGYVSILQEAEVMKALAVSMGIPPQAILLETKAANTYENVKFVSEILREKRWKSVAVVSSPYHMRRLLLVFQKNAPDISAIFTPIPSSEFYGDEGYVQVHHIQAVLHEYLAILYYWLKGYL